MPGNNQDPWGRKQDGPPDLIALLKRVFNSPKGGGSSGGTDPKQLTLLWIIPVIFIVLWFLRFLSFRILFKVSSLEFKIFNNGLRFPV